MGRGDYHRWNAKSTTGSYHSIKITDMKRLKALPPGWHSCQWKRNGERIGSISFFVTGQNVTFHYSFNGNPVEAVAGLDWTPCNYGGKRAWFICSCGERVGRVFIARHGVGCRHCLKLAYTSQNEDAVSRAWGKISKLEDRLKDKRYRPKGMHWKTYLKIRERIARAHEEKNRAFVLSACRALPSLRHFLTE